MRVSWYPKTILDLDVGSRERKTNKFGGVKHVYPRDTMRGIRSYFMREIALKFPAARILYFT